MPTLRLLYSSDSGKHEGEVFCCAYLPDSSFVLSAGWDGHLRLWEANSGGSVTALRVGSKPLSACTTTPDGKQFVAGSMEGLLSHWDAQTHLLKSQAGVHTRPISALCFSPDGLVLASTSWDRQLSLRSTENERDNRMFLAHEDIVAGCRFSPDGRFLLTWSHDRCLKWWDLDVCKESATLTGHKDRVTTADLSPDGAWAVSASRNGEVVLWDLETRSEAGTLRLGDEVRGCYFLLDGSSLLVAEASGAIHLVSVPDMQPTVQVATHLTIQCGALAPNGQQLALGGEDGVVRFVAIEGCEDRPLLLTPTQSVRVTATRLQKWFGRSSQTLVYSSTCPTCRHTVERLECLPADPFPCPNCRRPLRFNRKSPTSQPAGCR